MEKRHYPNIYIPLHKLGKTCHFYFQRISNSDEKFERATTSTSVCSSPLDAMWTSRATSIRIGHCLRTTAPRQKRSLHTVLKLPYENLEPNVNGVYPVFSAEGFRSAWTERQGYLISQVNRITQGMSLGIFAMSNVRDGNCS